MIKLIIASGNKNKIHEIISILELLPHFSYQLVTLPPVNEPEEPFNSFIENAVHKALYYGKISNVMTLSEDTGLSIQALGGNPGVHTKKFIEDQGGMTKGIQQLKTLLRDKNDLAATMTCVAALYLPHTQSVIHYEAIERGTLTFPARGNYGFGFDPIFIPEGQMKSIAELGQQFKNQHCHRALAINGLFKKLLDCKII